MKNRSLRAAVLGVAALLAASCSSDRTSSTAEATTPTSSSVTTATATTTTTTPIGGDTTLTPPTSTPNTAPPGSTAPTTAPPPTSAPCPATGDGARKASTDPLALSAMVGVDIRLGDHSCFERVVIELAGSGDWPGWAAEYVDDPVSLGESDLSVEIAGDATLLVRMGTWMPTMEGDGYSGPTQFFPTTVEHIAELRQTENWEGMTIWAIGIDAEYPFTVTMLQAPARLVIDFQVAEGA